MTTLTIRFKGLQEQVLDRLVETGVAETKSEAVRMAILNLAYQMKMLDDATIVDFLRRQYAKTQRSPEEILAAVERAKHETVTG